VLGKAGLSEDVLEADCTFFKVLIAFPKHERSQILLVCEFLSGIHTICSLWFGCEGKGEKKRVVFYEEEQLEVFVDRCTIGKNSKHCSSI